MGAFLCIIKKRIAFFNYLHFYFIGVVFQKFIYFKVENWIELTNQILKINNYHTNAKLNSKYRVCHKSIMTIIARSIVNQ